MDLQPQQVLRLRIPLEDFIAMGPGKATLLEAILETGSISAAGRRLGMSYRKAWQLVEETTRVLGEAVVTASIGGSGGGGASLTPAGEKLVEDYRAFERAARRAAAPRLSSLARRAGR